MVVFTNFCNNSFFHNNYCILYVSVGWSICHLNPLPISLDCLLLLITNFFSRSAYEPSSQTVETGMFLCYGFKTLFIDCCYMEFVRYFSKFYIILNLSCFDWYWSLELYLLRTKYVKQILTGFRIFLFTHWGIICLEENLRSSQLVLDDIIFKTERHQPPLKDLLKAWVVMEVLSI